MSAFIITVLTLLVFLVIYQIAKASEYASALKTDQKAAAIRENKLMAWLMMAFFILGWVAIYICHRDLMPKMLPVPASDHGVHYESMLKTTIYICGIVFVITQTLLFYFIFRYKADGRRTAFFYPHNNTIEVIWTTIPAIALVVLVVIGLRNWVKMTGVAPKDSAIVEITGKQFNWIIRYAGPDKIFGKTDYQKISDVNNVLGLDWNDPASHDDIVVQNGEMLLAVNKPVQLVIRSRDVLHDVGLAHFRMKMDAIPGIINSMWFTPKYTTVEMKEMTKDPEFVYEISCDQMCGKGHYSMRGIVTVKTQAEVDKWLSEQQTYYSAFKGEAPPAAPAAEGVAPTADSSKTSATVAKK